MKAIRVRSASQWTTVQHLHAEIAGRDLTSVPGIGVLSAPVSARRSGRRGMVWLAVDGEVAVATIRALYGADGELRDECDRYGLGPFAAAVGSNRLVVYDQLAILPEYRSKLAAPLLRKVVAEDSLRRGADVAFHACDPAMVATHVALGFRRYVGGDASKLDGRVPMVLVYSDRAHLTAVGSPIRHRIPGSIPAAIDPALARLIDGAATERRCRRHARGLRRRSPTLADRPSEGATAWWLG